MLVNYMTACNRVVSLRVIEFLSVYMSVDCSVVVYVD